MLFSEGGEDDEEDTELEDEKADTEDNFHDQIIKSKEIS